MNCLLIWDIDGTLIQGRGIGRRAMEKAFLELYGIQGALRSVEMAGMLDSMILKKAFAIHSIGESCRQVFLDKYCEYLEADISALESGIEAPGIPELLKAAEERPGIYNALGTGNIERGARIKLSLNNLNRHFPVGGFGDEEMERWQVIEKAAAESVSHYGVRFRKSEVFVIGDTPRDVECGRKLGYRTVAVATGMHTCSKLEECGADYVFCDLSDTEQFFSILGRTDG